MTRGQGHPISLLSPRVEPASYLGHPLLVGNRTVTVYAPDGRKLGLAYSMSGARRIVRGYRKAGRG